MSIPESDIAHWQSWIGKSESRSEVLDAEALLLVDDDEAEVFEMDVLVEQAMRADDVFVVIFNRLFDGFADRLESCKMDDSLAIKLAQGGSHGGLVANIALNASNFLAGDGLDAFQRFRMAIGEVVENDHFLTGLEKFDAGMRADIAGPASHENHRCSPLKIKVEFYPFEFMGALHPG